MKPSKLQLMKNFAHLLVLYFSTVLALGAAAAPAPADQDHFDAETGYRMTRYRAPTPDSVVGGTRINVDELDRLVRDENAILIDVMVAEGAGVDPKTGDWRLLKPRKSLPGSVWLADVGKGKPKPEIERYYKQNLRALTSNNKDHPIIIFCMADCWMSWNAVRRAASYGYSRVYWYPEGTDGWRDWGRPFVAASPRALTRVQLADARGSSTEKVTKTDAREAKPASPSQAEPVGLPQGEKTVTLISYDGKKQDIAKVNFKPGTTPGTVSFSVKLIDAPFKDEFLSMRPFRCLPDTKEMWCHLAYPYTNKREISAGDLQDLEYDLLFLYKPPKGYGIDAWNGLYFKLALQADGSLNGTVFETDMNVLAIPPDEGVLRPITYGALSEVEPDAHRFHTVEIR